MGEVGSLALVSGLRSVTKQIAAKVTQFAGRATSPCHIWPTNKSFNKFMERPPRTGHQGSTATGGSITR